MYNSPFTVAGMSSSTSSHHAPNTWGSTSASGTPSFGSTPSFGDSLSQSRSHYQSGYLMSSQNNNVPQGSQRVDEVPVVQTKAKMNHILSRGSTTDFGMDSMFQSSRQRQTLADEDAPPSNSVNDIPNDFSIDSGPANFQPRNTVNEKPQFSTSRRPTNIPSTVQSSQPLYIIVFGYPPDKYSLTVEYFKSLGDSTEADPHTEIVNCFRIGYNDPGDAMRAVRKNGEILGGTWMVGAKWADAAQAEALLGQPRSTLSAAIPQTQSSADINTNNAMNVDEPYPSRSSSNTPAVGTPIKLAPSMAAFRKAPAVSTSASKPITPQHGRMSTSVSTPGANAEVAPSPSKGVLGQVSDLIFGW
ncbi:hypothetical protein CPC08DRAFT_705881 [Agrocybe pediades]|nr:hypothetical protein CPC08DRAFT_705881 [Agrocybe pediades]